MRNVGDVIGAFLIGVAVGTVIGILYAPQSGEETRKFISTKASSTVEELNQKVNSLKSEIEKLKNEATKYANEIFSKISEKASKKTETENS